MIAETSDEQAKFRFVSAGDKSCRRASAAVCSERLANIASDEQNLSTKLERRQVCDAKGDEQLFFGRFYAKLARLYKKFLGGKERKSYSTATCI